MQAARNLKRQRPSPSQPSGPGPGDRRVSTGASWTATPRSSTTSNAAKNEYNPSLSRYVSVGEQAEVLSLDEAVVELHEAKETLEAADRELKKLLKKLGI